MARLMSVEQRLREWAIWLQDTRLILPTGSSLLGRIQDEQYNAGAGDECRPELIDGVACRPDGGLGRLAQRMGAEIDRDRRCRDIHELVQSLPEHYLEALGAGYVVAKGQPPRSERSIAGLLGITQPAWRERRAALKGWFEGALFRSVAA
jgi:hypothetical protein